MLVTTKAIVLSALKFKEKSLIVKCFTQSDGLKSYFVQNAFSGKNNKQKIAYFQPLMILEIEANHKNKGTLESFREVRVSIPYQTIPTNILKSTIVLFLSEVLHHSIHEEEKNESLFDFIETALVWLDTHEEMADFHLIVLLQITKYLGFYPDTSDSDFPYFEINEGIFTPFHGISCLTEHETQLLKKLLELRLGDAPKSFHVIERQLLLRILVNYYEAHLSGFRKPKSLEVLREVFM